MSKCSVCKVYVPPKTKVCPLCGREFTRFEYFRMNWLKKTVLLIIAAVLLYNFAIVIAFNREIRSYIANPPDSHEELLELGERYERLNPFQKNFVHYSEIENMGINVVHETTVGDSSVEATVYSQNGSVRGSYKGELLDGQPDGIGEFYFTDNQGRDCIYEGEFKEGRMEGFGEMKLSTGEVLRGSFAEGQLDGYAKQYSADGMLELRGMFLGGRMNGEGVAFGSDGNIFYEGTFVNGIPEKNSFAQTCEIVEHDELINGRDELICTNVKIDGMLTDIFVGEDSKQYYIFSPEGDDTNRFCVTYLGENVRLTLWENYSIYGYCESYDSIEDSHGKKTTGLRLKGYYITTAG